MSRVAGRTAHEWVDGIVSVLTSSFCPEHLQTVIAESLSVGLGDDNGPLTTRSVDQSKRQFAADPNDDNVNDVSGSDAMESSGNGGGNSAWKTAMAAPRLAKVLQTLADNGFFDTAAKIAELKMAIAGRQDDGSARFAWMPAAAASIGLCSPSDASPAPSGVTSVGMAMAQLVRSKKGAPRSMLGNKDETLFQDESEVDSESSPGLNVPSGLKKRTNLAKLRAAVRLGASSGSKVEEEKTQELVQVLHEQLRECEKQADDPSDNTSEKKLKLPIIRRDSRSKLSWDMLVSILALVTIMIVPLKLGFDWEPHSNPNLRLLEYFLDLLFFLDCIICFRTTYVDGLTREDVDDPRLIATHYLSNWFIFDIIGSFPVHEAAIQLNLLKLFRVTRLRRVNASGDLMPASINPFFFRLFRLMLVFFVTIHFLACGYYKVAVETCSRLKKCRGGFPDFDCDVGWDESLGGCQFAPDARFEPETAEDQSATLDRYAASLHWTLMASQAGVTFEATHSFQTTYAFLVTASGLLVDAILIGSIAQVLSSLDARNRARRDHTDRMNQAMQHHRIPNQLRESIRHYNAYLWENGHATSDASNDHLFDTLPEYIKKQYRLCKKQNLIREIPVIQAISSKEGKADFIHCLELQIKMPGDRICTQGMRGKEMYFLIRGSCQVYDENIQGGLYLTSLKAGSFFGEVALLNGCRLLNSASIRRGSIGSSNQMAGKGSEEVDVRRTASVYTQSFCELQVLGSGTFAMLMESYPIFKQIFRKVGEERLKLSRNMVRRKGVVRTTDKRKTFSESHADLLDIDRIASGGSPGQRATIHESIAGVSLTSVVKQTSATAHEITHTATEMLNMGRRPSSKSTY